MPLIRIPGRAEGGVAAIEFALALPVLLILGLAGMETANYAIVHLRVSNIAMTTSDNAARIMDSIDESDVNELFLGAVLAGKSIQFEQKGRLILYDLEPSSDGAKQWIRWQRCIGNKAAAPSFGRPMTAEGLNITDGTEIYASNRVSLSPHPSSEAASTSTAIGPPGRQIAAQPGTAVMVVEIVYDYQPLIANSFLAGKAVNYVSAFNVRQRTNQGLRNAAKVTPKSCG